MQGTNYLKILEGWGTNGVDIFFVISGFVMLHTQMERRRSISDFLLLRIIRIVPIYWIITSVVIILFLVLPQLFRQMAITPVWAISSFLFVSQLITSEQPVVLVGWTLEWEMLFYVIFAAVLIVNSWKVFVACVTALLVSIACLTKQFIIIEFIFGIMVAYCYKYNRYSHKTGIVLLILGSSLLLLSLSSVFQLADLNRVVIWGVPSFFIVLGAVYSRQMRHSLLSYLGDASYSIYLVQILSIPAFYKFSSIRLHGFNGDLLAIFCLCISVSLGCLLYSYVESPLVSNLRRFVK